MLGLFFSAKVTFISYFIVHLIPLVSSLLFYITVSGRTGSAVATLFSFLYQVTIVQWYIRSFT